MRLPIGMDIYRDILSLLPEGKVSGNGINFCCPFGERHSRGFDRSPSAGAWLGNSGQLIARCHACKADFPMFVELTGVPAHQWFPDRQRFAGLTTERLERTPKRVASWEYFDIAGKWIGTKEKFQPGFHGERKTYVWRWPNNEKNESVGLYQLPDIIAQGQADYLNHDLTPVLIVEGEKDADTLTRHGFTATCSPHGSNQWLSVHSNSLTGRYVVIFPDNDKPGQDYADRVAGALVRADVAALSIAVPGQLGYTPPEKGGDVSDWLEAHDQPRETVLDLLDSLPVYQPTRR